MFVPGPAGPGEMGGAGPHVHTPSGYYMALDPSLVAFCSLVSQMDVAGRWALYIHICCGVINWSKFGGFQSY